MEDLVSVIMPVFNSSKTLAQSIDSILVQSYSNFEILIVDDFSVDDSWRIISDYMKMDSRVIGIKLSKNVGAAQSRNIGIDKATGRFIAFLDADDYWLPNKLERQIEFAIKKKAAISHTSYKWIDSQGKELSKMVVAKKELTYNQMLDYNYIGCLTAIYDIKIIGGKRFMPDIRKRQDYGLWLRIMREGHKAYGLNEVLAFYRTGVKSLSSNKWDAARYNYKLLREVEGLSTAKSTYHFLRYVFLAINKHFLS